MLIWLGAAWVVGLLLADEFNPPQALLFAAIGLSLTGVFLGQRRLALLLLMLALGGLRYQAALPVETAQSIWRWNGEETVVIGFVSTDPKRTEEGQQFTLTVEEAGRGEELELAEGQVLVTLAPYPAFHYGQRLRLIGKLRTPLPPERPGTFDYRAYLARKSIFSLLRDPTIEVLPGTFGNGILASLMVLRDRCQAVLLRELPEPQASLAVGILLGLQASIPDQVYQNCSVTGTSHILVISGWNITIIAAALYGLFAQLRLPRGAAFWAILSCIWLYTLFVGASATVIRAAVMGTLTVTAQRLDRKAHAWTTLVAAVWAMTLVNPQTLWDLGFQLSSLATASLFAYGKSTEALLRRVPLLRSPWLGWALEALTATLAAQVLALPLMLFHFGNLSLIAPVANVVLLPVVPYAMLTGSIALVCGLLWLPLGQVVAMFAWLPLTWLTVGTALFARLPLAAVPLPPFPLWALLGYYALLGLWALHKHRPNSQPERKQKFRAI